MPQELAIDMVVIDYTNHKNERRERSILPKYIYYGSTVWHAELQWMLVAHDTEKNEVRTFAMSHIHSWRSANVPTDSEVVRKA